jgi:hypothetical protein
MMSMKVIKGDVWRAKSKEDYCTCSGDLVYVYGIYDSKVFVRCYGNSACSKGSPGLHNIRKSRYTFEDFQVKFDFMRYGCECCSV